MNLIVEMKEEGRGQLLAFLCPAKIIQCLPIAQKIEFIGHREPNIILTSLHFEGCKEP
jgi:hypothetical protein